MLLVIVDRSESAVIAVYRVSEEVVLAGTSWPW